MEQLKRLYWRLGTPDAINWQNVVTITLLHTSGSIITSGVDFAGRFGEFLLVRFAGLVVFFAVLGLGKLALIRFARTKPRPLVTLTCFAASLSAGTYVFDLLLIVTGFTDQSFFARRLILSAAGLMAVLALVSAVVTTAREFAAQNHHLSQYLQELEDTRQDTQERLVTHREELVSHIRQMIGQKLDTLPISPTEQATTMRTLIDDVIRPASHAIAATPPTTPVRVPMTFDVSIPWRVVLRDAMAGNPYSRLILPLTLGVVAGGFLIVSFGIRGVLATAGIVLLAMAINQVLRLLWPPVALSLPTWVLAVLFTLSVAPTTAGTILVINALTGFALFTPQRLTPWIIILLVTWWSSAVSVSVFRRLQETSDLLDVAVTQLRHEVASLNSSLRHQQKMISRALHGPVQAAVTSALHRLNTQPDLAVDETFVESIKERIEHSLEELTSSTHQATPLPEVLEDTMEVWEGLVTITTDISGETFDTVSHSPAATSALAELVREAVSNAVKHGLATQVHITLVTDPTTHTATLTVTNNGTPVADDAPPGLGTALFTDLCVQWDRASTADGVRVTGVIPLYRVATAQ